MSTCCQHKADKDQKKKHAQFWNSPDDKFPKIKWDKHAKSDQPNTLSPCSLQQHMY